MESELNQQIEYLYERSSRTWHDYIKVDSAYRLYLKREIGDGSYDTITDYITVNAYKIDGNWYIDYFNDLLYINP